jgi:hypothetical protein
MTGVTMFFDLSLICFGLFEFSIIERYRADVTVWLTVI